MNRGSTSMGVIVGILLVIVIGLAVWFGYTQGYFTGTHNDQKSGSIDVKVGGSSN